MSQNDWQEIEKSLAMSTTRDGEEIVALVAKFKAVNAEESLDGDEVIRSQVTRKESTKNISSTWLDRHFSSHSAASSIPTLGAVAKDDPMFSM